jgi:hypothetical protein
VTGSEDRQWLYPAMTRGTDLNLAFVFTTPPKVANPQPGVRPAAELDRYDRIRDARAGYAPPPIACEQPDQAGQREPIAVLADILGRRNHSCPPRPVLRARHGRAPPGRRQPLSHQARWLFRTLHAAELAGLDPTEVIGTAMVARELTGARDIAAVIDARIRPRVHRLFPQPQGPWKGRIPRLPNPGRRAYLAEIAAMMDDHTRRLGQHAAQTSPTRAIHALGPLPADADADARRHWEQHAADIAAYRETYGYSHPSDPIGPEPSHRPPGQRAAWHQAFAALAPVAGPDVHSMPDGRLWLLRDTYTAETFWAPRHVGKDLRLARLAGFDAALGAIRADAELRRRYPQQKIDPLLGASLAAPSPAGRDPARRRSWSRSSQRSSPWRGSSSLPPSTTSNPRPLTNVAGL